MGEISFSAIGRFDVVIKEKKPGFMHYNFYRVIGVLVDSLYTQFLVVNDDQEAVYIGKEEVTIRVID